jgi:hypothetical protein
MHARTKMERNIARAHELNRPMRAIEDIIQAMGKTLPIDRSIRRGIMAVTLSDFNSELWLN